MTNLIVFINLQNPEYKPSGPLRYMENGFQSVNCSKNNFYSVEQHSVFTKGVILETDVRLKKICIFRICTIGENFFWVFLFPVLLHIKAVILIDFHKTIKNEWILMTEISSHLIA